MFYSFFILLLDLHMVFMVPERTVIKVFRYGGRAHGDRLALSFTDLVPGKLPSYSVNITHSQRDLQPNYTHVFVEYIYVISKVKVSYKESTQMITFAPKVPLVDIPFMITAYAMPINKHHRHGTRSKHFLVFTADLNVRIS